ncbi:MAG TPA: hypothetical protein VK716_11215 [Terracidiphilus sp.]|jgi:hypothetical protein|nr:hypothetical protein [Terracidiphilus sp.]
MNLKRIVSQYASFFLLAVVFEVRGIWEYSLAPNIRLLLVESLLALSFLVIPFPLEAFSTGLEKLMKRKKIIASVLIVLLVGFVVAGSWRQHSGIWTVLNAFLGLFLLLVVWRDRIFSNSEERWQAKRAKTQNLLANRTAFEKSWQLRIKIVAGIFALLFALVAVVCWRNYSSSFVVLPILLGLGILELPSLILLLAKQTPMSNEKFEQELARAKALYERTEAQHTKYAARRAGRTKRLEEQKQGQRASNPSASSFYLFIYWSVMLCVDFQRWHPLRKPDLVFCAIPAWFLVRAIYFLFRQRNSPKGPNATLVPGSTAAGQE